MTGVFSVHDLDYLWQSTPEMDHQPPPDGAAVLFDKLNSSSSDWTLDSFIQEASNSSMFVTSSTSSLSAPKQEHASANHEASLRISQHEIGVGEINKPSLFVHSEPSISSEEYQAVLRGHLDLACAAVANTMVTSGKIRGSSPQAENSSDASKSSKFGSHGLDPAPTSQKKSGGQGALTTSDSSRELSDDDDLDGDLEATGNVNTPDDKRARRMLSNRESARRSRRRKQEHMNEMEMQVAQLKVENSSLSQRMTGMSQKYKDAAVDNRVLKANIETLRAKVKMAEESVKRATGINPLPPSMPAMPWQSFSGNTLGVNPTMHPGGSFDENLP